MALVLSRGGEAGRAKEIVGADLGEGLPLFSGEWSVAHPAKGETAFRIEPGVSHITLQGVRIRGYAFGVHAPAAPGGAERTHLRFEDVKMEQLQGTVVTTGPAEAHYPKGMGWFRQRHG